MRMSDTGLGLDRETQEDVVVGYTCMSVYTFFLEKKKHQFPTRVLLPQTLGGGSLYRFLIALMRRAFFFFVVADLRCSGSCQER